MTGYTIAGIITCVFVVTTPFGIAAFQMASYVAWPFGRAVVQRPSAGVGSGIMSFVRFVFCDWRLVLGHVIAAVTQATTIVDIVGTIVLLEMIPIACSPFDKQIVDRNSLTPQDRPLHSIWEVLKNDRPPLELPATIDCPSCPTLLL